MAKSCQQYDRCTTSGTTELIHWKTFIKEATPFMDLFGQTEAISSVAYKLRPSALRKPETRKQNLTAWGLSSLADLGFTKYPKSPPQWSTSSPCPYYLKSYPAFLLSLNLSPVFLQVPLRPSDTENFKCVHASQDWTWSLLNKSFFPPPVSHVCGDSPYSTMVSSLATAGMKIGLLVALTSQLPLTWLHCCFALQGTKGECTTGLSF